MRPREALVLAAVTENDEVNMIASLLAKQHGVETTVVRVEAEAMRGRNAAELLKVLKRLCGSGGTLKLATGPDASAAFEIEIQGDHADRLVAELAARGYRVKRAGG